MNILVLMKQTFDTEEKITLTDGKVNEDGIEFIINPYDEYAVEEAIKMKENNGGEVTIVSLGPSRTESAIRTAMAMGADKAFLVENEDVALDEFSAAQILSSVIKEQEYDLILCGHMAVDDGSSQVPQRIAELLNIPYIGTAVKIETDQGQVVVERDVEGDTEIVEAALPVIIAAQQGLNEPRYPSLPGIMKAKKKPLNRIDLDEIELNEREIEPRTEELEIFLPPKKEAGRILQGDLTDQTKELIQLLHNEAKVI